MIGVGLLALAFVLVLTQGQAKVTTFEGAFVSDGFARFMKLLTLAGSIFALLLSMDYLEQRGIRKFEYAILIVLSTLGMMMMISANDLIALYLGLEPVARALRRGLDPPRRRESAEAGLKYFVLGALSSACSFTARRSSTASPAT